MYARAGSCSRALMPQGSPSTATHYASLVSDLPLLPQFCFSRVTEQTPPASPSPQHLWQSLLACRAAQRPFSGIESSQSTPSSSVPPSEFTADHPLHRYIPKKPTSRVCMQDHQASGSRGSRTMSPPGLACMAETDSPRPGSQTSCSAQELPCRCSQLCRAAPGALHNHWRP